MSQVSSEIKRIFELQCQQKWVNKESGAEQRIAKLKRLKQIIQSREEDVRQALYADLGRTEETSQSELDITYADIDDAIANLASWMSPAEVEPSPMLAGCRERIIYEARGIVLLYGAWNFPISLLIQPLIPIIAAGNCALIKPNEVSPHSAKVIAEIIREAFDERDAAVFEGGVDLANELLELPVDHIFFTGSPAVGKIVMAGAAKHLASVTLELGGKNPVIIDRTADLQDAAAKITAARNLNAGQVCLCPENVWIPEEKGAEFFDAVNACHQAMFYRDGELNPDATGKIVDERNFQRVTGYIEDAKEKGAKVVFGGASDSETLTIQPTLMTNVPENAAIMEEETFGPILNVFTYKDVDEVVLALQKQHKPLGLYLFSKDDRFIDNMLRRTSSGGVTVNNCMMHAFETRLPFGGVGNSGMGSYRGEFGFRELSHQRAVLQM
jgi:aldehyde dehydrogenase (NAD+)